ncbi:hypothetical protein DFH07DRAFT_970076 [Mycena maculata]|uniref:Uncharacterized protein n=1 Tax=Mycena maculata TaxID=230809 RepID=A0AAD7HUP3_9AGAR|nr:hypothetical protein DFH07DRAFT_970076 [Mycena maculata]
MPSKTPILSAHASRNPTKAVQKPRARGPQSDAVKATLKKISKPSHWDYDKPKKYIRQVLENGVKYTGKRAPSLKNAIAHDLSKKAREEGQDSNIMDIDLSGEEYIKYRDSLSQQEQDRLIAQLD